jgi:hypothetical protein
MGCATGTCGIAADYGTPCCDDCARSRASRSYTGRGALDVARGRVVSVPRPSGAGDTTGAVPEKPPVTGTGAYVLQGLQGALSTTQAIATSAINADVQRAQIAAQLTAQQRQLAADQETAQLALQRAAAAQTVADAVAKNLPVVPVEDVPFYATTTGKLVIGGAVVVVVGGVVYYVATHPGKRRR